MATLDNVVEYHPDLFGSKVMNGRKYRPDPFEAGIEGQHIQGIDAEVDLLVRLVFECLKCSLIGVFVR